MSISKFNSNQSIDWGVNTEGMKFQSLDTLKVDQPYKVLGMFITPDNGYGQGAALITEYGLINLPQRYVDTVKEILNDPDTVEQIKEGKAGFFYNTFISKKYKRESYDVRFIDL